MASSRVAFGPRSGRVPVNPAPTSVFHHILGVGQSNSTGADATNAVSTATPHPKRAFMLNTISATDSGSSGIRAPQNRLVAASEYTSLVPIAESNTTDDIYYVGGDGHFSTEQYGAYAHGETPGSSMLASLTSQLSWFRGAYSVCGVGGRIYTELARGTDPYTNGMTQVAAVRRLTGNSKVYAITCQHGEADASNSSYSANLQTWRSNLTTDIQAITGQTESPWMLLVQVASMADKTSALQQLAATQADSRILIAMPGYAVPYSGLHRTPAGQRQIGAYFAHVYRKLISGQTWAPLQPSSVSRNTATITVNYSVPVGSLVRDTTNIAAQTNDGFEFTDDSGATPTISSVTVNTSSVTIVLSGTPTGSNKRIKYGITPGKGNVRDSETARGFYGDALYNWSVLFDMAVT